MSHVLLALIVGIPLVWHFGLAAVTAYDAGRVGLSRRKWTAVALLVPLFGFLAYLFERSEITSEFDEDPSAIRDYQIHESRRDDEGRERRGQ